MRRLIWYTISYTMLYLICFFFFILFYFLYLCLCFLTAYCAPIKNLSDNGKSLGYSTTFWMDIDLENYFRSLIIYSNNFIMSLFLCFFNFYFYFLIIYLVSFPHNDAPIIFQTVVVSSAQVIHSVTRWWWFC